MLCLQSPSLIVYAVYECDFGPVLALCMPCGMLKIYDFVAQNIYFNVFVTKIYLLLLVFLPKRFIFALLSIRLRAEHK